MQLESADLSLPGGASVRRALLLQLILPVVLLVLGIYHGLIQTLERAGLIQRSSLLGLDYYQGLTLHGVVNAIVFTTFFAVAFGHSVIWAYLKQVPNRVAVWGSTALMVIGTLMAAAAILSGSASVLYTFYPPLKASPIFYIGATLLVVGSWIAFFSWLPIYAGWRRAHPGERVPLAVLGVMTTFIVWFMATVPLAIEVIGLLIPWSLGWTSGVDVMLARTLFWAFGHALVYFWLLPAYTMLYAMMPEISGGKLYSDAAARLSFLLFIVFSCPVGVHHQFSDPGIGATWKWMHTFLTFGVAMPSFITAFTLAASMEFGARARGGQGLFAWWGKLPYRDSSRWMFAYIFCGLLLFLFGGITGLINASAQMNGVVHNTSWIPGHFHTTVGGLVFLAFIGMTLHLVSQLLGKPIAWPKMNQAVPYLWLAGVLILSIAMSYNGLLGEPRRTNLGLTYANPSSPLYQPSWRWGALGAAAGGIVMTLSMVAYFAVFFKTLFSARTQEARVAFPTGGAVHGHAPAWTLSLRPWLLAAAVLFVVMYIPPLLDLSRGGSFAKSPRYLPGSPLPEQVTTPSLGGH